MAVETVVPPFGRKEDRAGARSGKVSAGTRSGSSGGGAASTPGQWTVDRPRALPTGTRVESKQTRKDLPVLTLEQLLSQVPAEDRPAIRAFVQNLQRTNAPEDLIRWHIAKKIPGAELPPVASPAKPRPAPVALPARIERALAQRTPQERERIERFQLQMGLGGMSAERIAWKVAQHLGLVPKFDPKTGRRVRRKKRGHYVTFYRSLLLAHVATQPGRTCDLAKRADIPYRTACAGMLVLLVLGYVARNEDEEGRLIWSATSAGLAHLYDMPEFEQGTQVGPVVARFLIEEKRELRAELMKLGWSYDQNREVLPMYTLPFLKSQFDEVRGLHQEGWVWNPGGLLYWRLGAPARGMRLGKQMAMKFVAKENRWQFVEAAAQLAQQENNHRRLDGLATKVVPEGLGGAFLMVMEKEEFPLARRLAYTLAKKGRNGWKLEVQDVHETLHWIRKDMTKKDRQTRRGESRTSPTMAGQKPPPPRWEDPPPW